jgi:hypothetical protein
MAAEWRCCRQPHGDAKFVDSPFGKAVFHDRRRFRADPSSDALNVGAGDFTVAAWIHPAQLRKAAIVALGDEGKPGWYLDLADNRGTVRFETMGPTTNPAALSSTPGAIRLNTWQHVAVVIKREQPGEREKTKRESTSTGMWSRAARSPRQT